MGKLPPTFFLCPAHIEQWAIFYWCALERKCHDVPGIFQEVECAPTRWGVLHHLLEYVQKAFQKQTRTETEEKVFEESLRKSPVFERAAPLGGGGGPSPIKIAESCPHPFKR